MSKHIGIVACSAEGAALCYRTICLEASAEMGTHMHPEVSMHTHCLGEYMRFIRADDWRGVAALMLSSAEKLAGAGADLLVCPDNTIHQAMPWVTPTSPRPWLHIAGEVAAEAVRQGHRRLGILGTRYLMEGPVYPEQLAARGVEHVIPPAAERGEINRIIFDELVNGQLRPAARETFRTIIAGLAEKGCDAVVLGCTEIPLIVAAPEDSPLPTLDSTRLLARAAIRAALA